ncbi:class I SAM-dependent methyltransferase [Nocardioides sediminis]|uniref:class I SAM-dependent methyltransferase n=1 Tax=Nocardioides sediminis TaxID=433648 RepID=UPI000D303D90|nr:methyltransferase domain-containing protein [Nocardioides sediminis]
MSDPVAATVRAYDLHAVAYAELTAAPSASVRAAVERFAAGVGAGGRVLEVGSGGGRDAALMEDLGLRVRRTDVTPGFVALLREQGHAADLLDPLVDDLPSPEGPYDGVWANASLLHVARADLPAVQTRLAAVTRQGGLLHVSVKEGVGEGWSTHGAVRAPRHFTYWQADTVRGAVTGTGWNDIEVARSDGDGNTQAWLEVTAVRG